MMGTQQAGYDDEGTQEDSERTSEDDGRTWGKLLASGERSGDLAEDHALTQAFPIVCYIHPSNHIEITRHRLPLAVVWTATFDSTIQ